MSPLYGRQTHADAMALRSAVGTARRTLPKTEGRLLLVEVFAIGLIPIGSLALSLIEAVPLHISGPVLIASALLSALILAVLAPTLWQHSYRGYVAGLIAVLVYDCTRMPFVIVGGWPDFIPKIGQWLLDEPSTHWSIGYMWRYLGNGAGMGLSFAMLGLFTDRWIDRRIAGVVFGVLIWTGLIATLLAAPNGEAKLFQLTPTTIAVSLVGHLVYGAVLGQITWHWKATDRPKPGNQPDTGWRPYCSEM